MPGPGMKLATEATLRMPPRCRVRLGTKRSERSVSTRTLRSIMASCWARSRLAARPIRPKPALLTRNCGSRPRSRSSSSIRAAAPAWPRSMMTTWGRAWPRSSMASASALSCGARRAASTSAWPCSANTSASAAPMPAEAPVISATGFGSGMTSGTGELRDHLWRDRLGLDFFRVARIARRPDASVEAFDAKLAAEGDAVLHVEARPAELHDFGLDHHVVPELGRLQEARLGVHHRIALEFVVAGELILAHAERLREQRGGAAVEHREVARKEHDPGRVAVAPFDPCVARVGQHRVFSQRGAMRSAPSIRITSPLR